MAKAVKTITIIAAVATLFLAGPQYAMLVLSVGSLVSMAVAEKPKFLARDASSTNFVTNPQSAIPYAIGRTRQSGVRVHADTWTGFSTEGKQDILGYIAMLSGGGEIEGIEKFTADSEEITFNPTTGEATTAKYTNWMTQLLWNGGHQTMALMNTFGGGFPTWTSAHKLSGITHASWCLRYNGEGDLYTAGVPEPAWIGKWVKVYDPRLDSTYPGGSGSCRALNESTYIWSRNPALHALTWALGRWQNGKKVFGIGAPVENIRVSDFVEMANVCEANKWWCGGVVSSTDSKWEVFKKMLQAGGGVHTMTGAMIGCRVFTPKVSLTTIGSADLHDRLTFSATKSQRDRINTVIPRFASEDHDWKTISGSPVSVAAYVTADGRVRQKEYDLPLVQHEVDQTDVDGNRQAGQLTAYEIVNAREAGPIQFTTGPRFIGLKCGDCVTLNVPEEGFDNTKILITEPPKFDPATGKISFTAETETDSKHAFALGQTTTPPPPFAITPPNLTPSAPLLANWAVTTSVNGDGLPIITVAGGSPDGAFWNGIIIQWKKTTDTTWKELGQYLDATSVRARMIVEGNASYEVRIAYIGDLATSDWLTMAPVSVAPVSIGNNTATVMLYQRTTTATAPSVSTSGNSTYTFATGAISGQPSGWTTAIPDDSAGRYLWDIRAIARSNLATATIANADWSTPSVFVSSGTNGAAGAAAVTGMLTNENVTLFAYANGGIVSYTGASGEFKVYQGSTDVSSSFTLSTFDNPQALTIGYTGRLYSVTNGFDPSEDTATVIIRATGGGAFAGVTIDKMLTLSKAKGGYEIVSTLPTTNLFDGRIVYLNTDNKLYRYADTAWTVAVDGADIMAGSVTAAKLGVTQLSAITALIGTLRTATSGARTEIKDNVIKVYDSSNVLRVQIGDLSL